MTNPRKHGAPPFRVAVLHGGPGAGGEVAPVARELGRRRGVLEPIQTAATLEGQVAELAAALERHGAGPCALVGYSWGAWLAWLVAAERPALVERLVLVASGPFEEAYVARLRETRAARLDAGERTELAELFAKLEEPGAVARIDALMTKTDSFDPFPAENRPEDEWPFDAAIHRAVWREGAEARRSGALLAAAARVRCPVVAIHGDHDPHPKDGVRLPLSVALADFRFVLLGRCGHVPWRERHARAAFFEALEGALGPCAP